MWNCGYSHYNQNSWHAGAYHVEKSSPKNPLKASFNTNLGLWDYFKWFFILNIGNEFFNNKVCRLLWTSMDSSVKVCQQ